MAGEGTYFPSAILQSPLVDLLAQSIQCLQCLGRGRDDATTRILGVHFKI